MVVKSENGRNKKKNREMEINSDIDIDKSVRDTEGDRKIEIDVAAEVDRIIDRRVEQEDLHENTKKILTNIVQKMKDPMNLQVQNNKPHKYDKINI